MALNAIQKETIRTLVKTNYYDAKTNPNGLSNRAIAKEANCSESAVRGLIKREGLDSQKNAINALAKAEAHTILMQDDIKTQKNALSDMEKNAYYDLLDTEMKTQSISVNFQDQIIHRQELDKDIIETLKAMMVREIQEAETLEDVLKIKLRYRELMGAIVDYDEIKKAAEANDKMAITKKEAPRHAPKTELKNQFLAIVDTEEGTKGKF